MAGSTGFAGIVLNTSKPSSSSISDLTMSNLLLKPPLSAASLCARLTRISVNGVIAAVELSARINDIKPSSEPRVILRFNAKSGSWSDSSINTPPLVFSNKSAVESTDKENAPLSSV